MTGDSVVPWTLLPELLRGSQGQKKGREVPLLTSSSLSHCRAVLGCSHSSPRPLPTEQMPAEVITLCFPDIPAKSIQIQSPGLTRDPRKHEGLLHLKHIPHLLLPPGRALALSSAIIRFGFKHSHQVLVLNTPIGFWL